MTEVLVLGGAGVDHIVQVPALPLPFADTVYARVETRAGQTGDFMSMALHGLGLAVAHVDVLGDDPEGELVRRLHERLGIPFHTVVTPDGTKRSVNLVDPDGRRQSLYDLSRGAGGAELPMDVIARLAGQARHAHVSITEPCAAAMPMLAAAGLTVSTDLHDWDGRDPHHRAFADRADIVFVSAVNLADPAATLHELVGNGRTSLAVATAGADGGSVLDRAEGRVRAYAAAVPHEAVRDTNGAGDAFAAGFLLGRLTGVPLDLCLTYGAVAGAHACTVPASRVDPIDRETLLRRVRGVTFPGPGGG